MVGAKSPKPAKILGRAHRAGIGAAVIAVGYMATRMLGAAAPGWAVEALERCYESSPGSEECLREAALDGEQPAFCQKLSTAPKRVRCHTELATTTKEPRFCVAIAEDGERRECIGSAVRGDTDPEVCTSLSATDARWCQEIVAGASPGSCRNVPETTRHSCIMNRTEPVAFDDPVDECGGSIGCVAQLGVFDISVCERIPPTEPAARETCLKQALPGGRRDHQFKSVCRRVSDKALQQDCFELIGARAFGEGACAELEDEERRQACIQSAATAEQVWLQFWNKVGKEERRR